MTKKEFLKICKRDAEIVKIWAKWKQRIIISSESANTGKFIK